MTTKEQINRYRAFLDDPDTNISKDARKRLEDHIVALNKKVLDDFYPKHQIIKIPSSLNLHKNQITKIYVKEMLKEAQNRGFTKGTSFESVTGLKYCVVSSLKVKLKRKRNPYSNEVIGDVVNDEGGLVYERQTNKWAKIVKQ